MVQHLVRNVVDQAGFQRSLEYFMTSRRGIDRPNSVEKLFSSNRLDLFPEFVGPAYEWHVRRVLIVSETDYPVDAMRGTFGVRDVELLEAENFFAAFNRQVINCRTSHSTDA